MFKDILIVNKPLVETSPSIINACLPKRHTLGWYFKYKGKEYSGHRIEDIIDEKKSTKVQIKLIEEMVETMKCLNFIDIGGGYEKNKMDR